MTAAKDYRLGIVLSVGAAIAWSTAGFFTRLIPHDSFTILFWRGIFGAIGILGLIIVLQRRNWWNELTRCRWLEFWYMLLTAAGMMMFILSLNMTSVAHNAVIYSTIPFISALLGWYYLKEKPSLSAAISSMVALLGVVVMMGGGSDGGFWGDVLAFGMTLCMAVSILLARKYKKLATMPAVVGGSLLGSLLSWPFSDVLAVGSLDLGYLLAFGLISTALGNLFFAFGSRRIPAIETALIGALDTPLAPLWVFIAFAEVPGINTIIGGSIVFAAVIVHIYLSQAGASASAHPG